MKYPKQALIYLIGLIVVLVATLYFLQYQGFQNAPSSCSSLLAKKYDGENTLQSYLSAPVPNNLSITQKYIGGTGGSVKGDERAYMARRDALDDMSRVFNTLKMDNSACGNETALRCLEKFAKDKALSRFDLVQNQTCFVTIQQLSMTMSHVFRIRAQTPNDPRWAPIQKWFTDTSQIYARYFSGHQLSISTHCSPQVFFQNRFMTIAEAQSRKASFKTFNRLNNIQLSKLIMMALAAVFSKDNGALQNVVDEMIDHIDRNMYTDLFDPPAKRIVSNDKNGGTYNFQCGFVASEASRRSLILHYNSYYVMFLWTLFYIFKAASTKDKDWMQPFYKYKNDLSLIVRNMTDVSSVRSTATDKNAGQIYINQYKKLYMDKIKYDLTQPPPENRNQPAMQLISAQDAEVHKTNFAYFFGTMDMKISSNTCDMRGRPVSLTGMTQIPTVSLVHSSQSKELFESIQSLAK